MYQQILTMNAGFEVGKTYFLTYKGNGKHQRMDHVIKRLEKVSPRTFFLVRENNNVGEGYHYHALIKSNTKIKKSWFRKGVHCHLLEVGKGLGPGLLEKKDYNTKMLEEHLDMLIYEFPNNKFKIMSTQLEIQMQKLKNKKKLMYKKSQKLDNISRILSYMNKNHQNPVQYKDYYLRIRGKSINIIEPVKRVQN